MSSIHPYARLTIYYLVHTTIVLVSLLSLALTLTRAFLELLNGGLGILQVTLRYASKHLEDHECATEAWRDIGREELKVRKTGWKWPSNGAEVMGAFKGAGSMVRVVDDGMEQVMAREIMKNREVKSGPQRQAREEMLTLRKAVGAEPPGKGGLGSYADNTTPRLHSREGRVPPYTQPYIAPQIQQPLEYVMPIRSRTVEETVHGSLPAFVHREPRTLAEPRTRHNSAPLEHRREVVREGGCIWTAAGQWERI
ncbi:hypothetical protein, variant [Microbotryum lychnidis-dioicae p1A1 Lamole]|uniref:Uncharacterized protein n=1 Tax=Microbotryum lychnidis-dioicae (strain p1A1 Lamole / MvSl-1064) TaxID=683840 RepID=U5H0C1_USTV1|nr:hypothetical protein MVLG_00857 [Microbotryum lychnidis-dioicae p1A1 Lamole]KDE09144.1 hypothetical protein, variant [Microbotryum lychnidis-dioicae p1A1 Lamole]|eukprot:KDE09143.1 hypothetical protein MVLG_00857 [Microbotryum lychnidis-dioicae p1A1 Lamole]